MSNRRIYSRRTVLRMLGAVSVISPLALSCRSSEPEGETPRSSPAARPSTSVVPSSGFQLPEYVDRTRLEGELFVFNWGDYIDPDVLSDFERLTGVKVTVDTYDTNEQAIAKLQQGGIAYDIVVPTDYAVQILIGLGLLEPLDRSVVRAIEHLDPNNLNGPYDPGNRYSVPYFWGTSVMRTIPLFSVRTWPAGKRFSSQPRRRAARSSCTVTTGRRLQPRSCGSAIH